MPSLEWKAEYSVGNELIDSQHRGLLELIVRLEQALTGDSSRGQDLDLLTELVRYANNHFSTEEDLMRECGYPYCWEHEKSHLEFREDLARLAGIIMQGDQDGWARLLEFTHSWWQGHILGLDRDLFRYYHQHRESRLADGA